MLFEAYPLPRDTNLLIVRFFQAADIGYVIQYVIIQYVIFQMTIGPVVKERSTEQVRRSEKILKHHLRLRAALILVNIIVPYPIRSRFLSSMRTRPHSLLAFSSISNLAVGLTEWESIQQTIHTYPLALDSKDFELFSKVSHLALLTLEYSPRY